MNPFFQRKKLTLETWLTNTKPCFLKSLLFLIKIPWLALVLTPPKQIYLSFDVQRLLQAAMLLIYSLRRISLLP